LKVSGVGGWLQWGALLAAAIAAPLLCANALMSGGRCRPFLDLFGPSDGSRLPPLSYLLGGTLLVTALIGSETALGFVFDPANRDFPYAALTMAVVPLAMLMLNPSANRRAADRRGGVCWAVGDGLGLCLLQRGQGQLAIAVTCAMYVLLAVTLWQARGRANPKISSPNRQT